MNAPTFVRSRPFAGFRIDGTAVEYRANTSLDAAFYELELALIRFEIPVWRARYAEERAVPELVDLGGEA